MGYINIAKCGELNRWAYFDHIRLVYPTGIKPQFAVFRLIFYPPGQFGMAGKISIETTICGVWADFYPYKL
jgi:hypothetical protein